jgi:plasmid stabilization system protein ParE
MVKRKVNWTNTASIQLREVLEFWVRRNKSKTYSLKLLTKIESRINTLIEFPFEYPETSFPEVRVAAMNHYSIFYKVTDDIIIILAFWDNRQDPKKLLSLFREIK